MRLSTARHHQHTHTLFIASLLFTLLLTAACRHSPPAVASPSPEPSPTPLPALASPSPTPLPIVLGFPPIIAHGDPFIVSITNQSPIPYVTYIHWPPDNCLSIYDASGKYQPTTPAETCDALAEIIVPPNEARHLGSWDLKTCAATNCLTRAFAPPGQYQLSVTFYPHAAADSINPDRSLILNELFTIAIP